MTHFKHFKRFDCYICGTKNLINDPTAPVKKRLTVDHFVSLKDGGNYLDINNFRVCCYKCNQKKSGHYA